MRGKPGGSGREEEGAGGALAEQLAEAARELAEAKASGKAAAAAAAAQAAAAGAGTVALVPHRVADVLRRAVAAGWADQVARHVRSQEYLAQLAASRRKRHAVRYQPACLDAGGGEAEGGEGERSAVFLHPRSGLHAAAPELLVYGSLLRTDKRPYMVGLTAIEAEWLAESGTPLCVLSPAPLPDPPPAYRAPPTDAVVAWRAATYGRHAWPLPPVARRTRSPPSGVPCSGRRCWRGACCPGWQRCAPNWRRRRPCSCAPSCAAWPA